MCTAGAERNPHPLTPSPMRPAPAGHPVLLATSAQERRAPPGRERPRMGTDVQPARGQKSGSWTSQLGPPVNHSRPATLQRTAPGLVSAKLQRGDHTPGTLRTPRPRGPQGSREQEPSAAHRGCTSAHRCFLFFFLGGVSTSSAGAGAMMLDSLTRNSYT